MKDISRIVLKKKILFDLEYRIEGTKQFKHLEIDFVPNFCRKEFNRHMSMADLVRKKWDRISDIETLLVNEKDKDERQDLKDEQKACIDFIEGFSEMDVLQERFKIIEKILVKNGYAEDEELMSFTWWDENVEPSDINKFIELCIWKDVDKKKMN